MIIERLKAFMIDFIFIALLFMLCNLIPIIDDLSANIEFGSTVYIIYGISLILCLLILLCKDISGQSMGKKIIGIKVVSENNTPLKIYQKVIRNITFIIWPIEFLLLLMNKKKIGDILAKTKIVHQ